VVFPLKLTFLRVWRCWLWFSGYNARWSCSGWLPTLQRNVSPLYPERRLHLRRALVTEISAKIKDG
jgi:hypothetical protein